MSVLHLNSRPWVVFDPANKDHRKWFAQFQAIGTWGRCPVRFVISDDQGDLVTMIQRRLIDYYVTKEFDVAKKPQRSLVAKKAKKSVDSRSK